MSIDLHLEFTRPVLLRPLLPKISGVLAEMLGVTAAPEVTLSVLERGERCVATTDQLGDKSSPYFLLSIVGEPATVGLTVACGYVMVTMAAQRTNLEYALGAAVAIVLARELSVCVEDARRFFGDGLQKSAESLCEYMRVRDGLRDDLREAADQLTGRLDREW